MRLFLDTNVLASALGTRGLCLDLLRLVLDEHELVVSGALLDELDRVLRDKFRVPQPERTAARAVFAACTLANEPDPPPEIDCPDPSDVPLLGAALASGAALFVTGDKALVDLKVVQGMPVVPPREAWERVRNTETRLKR